MAEYAASSQLRMDLATARVVAASPRFYVMEDLYRALQALNDAQDELEADKRRIKREQNRIAAGGGYRA